MNELTLDGKIYVSSKQAAEMTGYAKDYVGQLCREGRVEARLVGRNWYVLKSAIEEHRFGTSKPENTAKEAVNEVETANPWSPPRYHTEEIPVIPVLKQAEPAVVEQEEVQDAPQANFRPLEAIGAMQEQWQDWFAGTPQPEEREESEEAVNIPLHTVSEPEIIAEAERVETRYPTYASPDEYIAPKEEERVIIRERNMRGRPILSAFLIVVMLFAAIIGYIGGGFAPEQTINHWPLSILAGVSTYTTH